MVASPRESLSLQYDFNEHKLIPSSGVPGELRGLEYLHKNYGVLPWATVLSPAIHLARHGFSVNEDQVRYMNTVLPNGNFLTQDPSWAIDFAPKGYLVKLNETMTRKRYADTLETIASEGADAFYSGAIANATVSAIQRSNGTLTVVDLKNYTVASRKPSEITYRGYKIRSCGTPAGGSVTLSALNIMNGYTDFQNPDLGATNLSTHRLIEAMRFAYGQRTELGDPSFLDGIDAFQEAMLSDSTAKEIRLRISDLNTNNISWYDPQGLEILETPGTSHITAADKSGLAISLTTTINTLFGSQVMVPETGIILNNEMNDFSIPGSSNFFGYIPSPANFVRPGKRPLSSMSPTIVETADGKFYLAIGSAGGSRIITATIQNIHHILDLNRTTAEALSQPRVHDQLNPSVSTFEWGYDNNTVAYIKAIGHNVSWVGPGQSTAQALRLLPNGTFEAAGEPRQLASGGYAI